MSLNALYETTCIGCVGELFGTLNERGETMGPKPEVGSPYVRPHYPQGGKGDFRLAATGGKLRGSACRPMGRETGSQDRRGWGGAQNLPAFILRELCTGRPRRAQPGRLCIWNFASAAFEGAGGTDLRPNPSLAGRAPPPKFRRPPSSDLSPGSPAPAPNTRLFPSRWECCASTQGGGETSASREWRGDGGM